MSGHFREMKLGLTYTQAGIIKYATDLKNYDATALSWPDKYSTAFNQYLKVNLLEIEFYIYSMTFTNLAVGESAQRKVIEYYSDLVPMLNGQTVLNEYGRTTKVTFTESKTKVDFGQGITIDDIAFPLPLLGVIISDNPPVNHTPLTIQGALILRYNNNPNSL